MATIIPRVVTISDTNQGPVVNLAAWFGMTVMILCVFTRIGSKLKIVRRWTADDSLIFATMIFAICHSVTLSLMVSNGLGQPQANLTRYMIRDFQKFGYASQLLYIPALCLGKLSTLVYLRALAPGSHYAILNLVLEGVVILWGISAEFSIAFQCNLPDPWALITSKCFDRIVFWNIIGALDALTDFSIIILPAYLVWGLQMPRSKKFLVVCVFGTRILTIPFAIVRLYYLSTLSSPHQPDQTLTSYHAYLFTTIQLNTSIFTACIPFLKPFLEEMSSGALSSSIEPMDSSYAHSKFTSFFTSTSRSRPKGSIRMSSLSEPPRVRKQEVDNMQTEVSSFHFGDESARPIGSLRMDMVSSVSHIRRSTPEEREGRHSEDSDRMIITRTREWYVREDFEDVRRGESTRDRTLETQ